jgi:hypothetical protein
MCIVPIGRKPRLGIRLLRREPFRYALREGLVLRVRENCVFFEPRYFEVLLRVGSSSARPAPPPASLNAPSKRDKALGREHDRQDHQTGGQMRRDFIHRIPLAQVARNCLQSKVFHGTGEDWLKS